MLLDKWSASRNKTYQYWTRADHSWAIEPKQTRPIKPAEPEQTIELAEPYLVTTGLQQANTETNPKSTQNKTKS